MNKKRHFLFTLIVIVLCVSMVFFAVACDDKDKNSNDQDSTETTDELFTNGEFTLSTGDTFPKAPTSWTSDSGYSSAPNGTDSFIAGVIDTTDKTFKNDSKTFGKIANPGAGSDKDPYVLMIYNKVKTSRKFTSTSISLDKDSYYKLSFKVKTLIDKDETSDKEQGVFVNLNGDAYASFKAINTDGQWDSYEIYIETSKIKSATSSITLTLSLGNGADYTKGHAFFDTVVLENLSKDNNFGGSDFANIQVSDKKAKYSMIAGDSEFDYTSGTGTILSPVKYSGLTGTGSDGSAPSSSSYVEKGVYNISNPNAKVIKNDGKDITLSVPESSIGNNLLVINNKQTTAYGYRATTAMQFAAAKYYQVSIQVRTENITTGGATLKLTNGKSDDDRSFVISDIKTNGAWETYSFFVQSNATRNNNLYIEMWLGEGGKNDTETHVKGVAMFDLVKIKDIDEATYTAAADGVKFSLASTGTKPIDSSSVKSTTYDESINTDLTQFTATANSIVINNTLPTVFSVSNYIKNADDKLEDTFGSNSIKIYPNNFYLISMMLKTEKIDKEKGLTINLVTINEDGKKYEDQVKQIASLTGLNSENLDDFAIEGGQTEIKFFIKGGIFETNEVGLQFILGTGKGSQSAGHVMGKVTIDNIKIENVTSSEYNNATKDAVTASAAFEETSGSYEVSSNGSFKLIDAAATKELYKDVKNNAGEKLTVFDEFGKLNDVLGVPQNWTISNKDYIVDETVANRSLSGVLDLNTALATTAAPDGFGIDTATFYNGTTMTLEDNATVLAFNAKNAAFGYSSNSINLQPNSYYMFTVMAKTVDSTMSIELATKSGSGKEPINFFNISTVDNKWEKFAFFVQTGVTSVNVKLTLSVGNPRATSGTDGVVFFNQAKYDTITEAQFKKAKEVTSANSRVQSWFVDSFDTTAPNEELSIPSNWSGSTIDTDAPSDSNTLASGVFDKTSGNWKNIDIEPDTDTDVYNAIFTEDENNVIGDSVLTIYNKKDTAYKYTSTSTTLKEKSFYKVSIYVLTYKLDKNDSATITLKLNNQTYSFGKKLNDNASDYDNKRQINTSTYENDVEKIGTWTQYNFYVKTEANVAPSASLSVGLGYSGKDNYKSGYVFIDNYSIEEITEESFIKGQEVAEGEEADETIIFDETLVPTNHRIVLTEEFANAEENKTEPEEETEEAPNKTQDLLWLWISSGIVGGVILLVLIVYLIKKFGKKKKKSFRSSKK